MSDNNTVLIANIQRFCVHDGPGIRTTIFFKGCPLNCLWCHNSETKKYENEIIFQDNLCIKCGICLQSCVNNAHSFEEGKHILDPNRCTKCLSCVKHCPTKAIDTVAKVMTTEEIIEIILRDKDFYDGVGGVTLSGGEPLIHPDIAFKILLKSKQHGLTTAVETSGYFNENILRYLTPVTDLFLFDYKDTNTSRHKKYTGVSNEKILHNLRFLDTFETSILLRCVMVKGINMDEENINGICDLYHSLTHCIGVELLPYHIYGATKNRFLTGNHSGNKDWIPNESELTDIKNILSNKNINIIS